MRSGFRHSAGSHAQPQVRLPNAVQDARSSPDRRDRVAGARDRRQRGDLFAVQPDAAAAAAGAAAERAGQPAAPGPEAGIARPATTPATATRSSATRCSATWSGSRRCSPASPRTSTFGANLSLHAARRRTAKACWCRAATSRCSACSRRSAGCSLPRTTTAHRRAARRRPQPRATGQRGSPSIPSVLNQTIIVNGQTMTIVGVAPRGFDGTTLGIEARGVRADHDARADAAGLQPQFENRRSYWAYLFARLQARRLDRAGAAAASTRSITRSSTTSRRRCRRA